MHQTPNRVTGGLGGAGTGRGRRGDDDGAARACVLLDRLQVPRERGDLRGQRPQRRYLRAPRAALVGARRTLPATAARSRDRDAARPDTRFAPRAWPHIALRTSQSGERDATCPVSTGEGEGIGEDLREEQAREGQHGEGRERSSCLRRAHGARSRAAGRGRRRHRHPGLALLRSAGDGEDGGRSCGRGMRRGEEGGGARGGLGFRVSGRVRLVLGMGWGWGWGWV